MSESSFAGGGDELTEGATVEGEDTVDSATADREAAYDGPASGSAGTGPGEDPLVTNPTAGTTVADDVGDSGQETSHDADVESGYDEESSA